MDGLTPGRYSVYTFDNPAPLEYRNPSALAALPQQGQEVTLEPNGSATLTVEASSR